MLQNIFGGNLDLRLNCYINNGPFKKQQTAYGYILLKNSSVFASLNIWQHMFICPFGILNHCTNTFHESLSNSFKVLLYFPHLHRDDRKQTF